jgi:hypothetical protein|tara:strand:+ start:1321 stop:1779 length:459 start_codon:yes stop_codon:yes gene_type:complete
MNKKVLYASTAAVLLVLVCGVFFIFSKSKSKDLILTIDKVFYAYSSFVIDLGYSPSSIEDLYENKANIAKWKGPYISKTSLNQYDNGQLDIIHASAIPTKKCSLDYLSNCYTWLKVKDFSTSDFDEIKEAVNKNAEIFYANNNVYFKITNVE